jgi:predicted nucleic acid-binding protein
VLDGASGHAVGHGSREGHAAHRNEASVRDAVHAAVLLNNDVPVIATFDGGFDRIPGVKRLPRD